MRKVLGRAALAATPVFVLAVVLLGWDSGTPPPVPQPNALALGCEEEIDSAIATREFGRMFVSASQLNNRLVHDCQKLLATPDEYGPLTSLQPANFRDVQWFPAGAGGASQAVLADIIDYGPMGYGALHIEPRLNCLWVTGRPTDPTTWKAAVRQGQSCVGPNAIGALSPVGARDTLQVKVIPYNDAHDLVRRSDHPSTARWGWDGRIQFIGIHCGRAWCEIGPRGFQGSGATVGDGIGLRDEQFLAITDDALDSGYQPSKASPLPPHPSHVWGRIEPDPIFATVDSMYLRTPRRVAWILLATARNDLPQRAALSEREQRTYMNRYKLHQRVPGVAFADIWMWFNNNQYFIATTPTTTRQNWKQTTRCPWRHASVGAVRWRWDNSDEAIWLACSQGCCNTTEMLQ